jgi:hypothetical protein
VVVNRQWIVKVTPDARKSKQTTGVGFYSLDEALFSDWTVDVVLDELGKVGNMRQNDILGTFAYFKQTED